MADCRAAVDRRFCLVFRPCSRSGDGVAVPAGDFRLGSLDRSEAAEKRERARTLFCSASCAGMCGLVRSIYRFQRGGPATATTGRHYPGIWTGFGNPRCRTVDWQDQRSGRSVARLGIPGQGPSWRAIEYVNAELDPSRHKILLIGETRGFWINVPFVAPSSFNGPQIGRVFTPRSEPKAWGERLHSLGITHLLISIPEWQRLRNQYDYFSLSGDDARFFDEWLRSLTVAFDDQRGTIVLSLPEGETL